MKKEREKGEYRYIEHLFVMYSVILPPICILFLPSEHILNPSNISDTRWIFSAAYIIWLIANVGFDSLSFYCTRRFFSVVINDEQLTFVKLIKYGFCDFIISGFCLLMTILATNLAYALELGNQDLNTLLSLTVDVAGTISKPFALNWGGNVIHLGVATLKQCKMH